MFARADLLLFKERKYLEAEDLYRQIVAHEKGASVSTEQTCRNQIDAWNSIGYCIKFRTSVADLLSDSRLAAAPDGTDDGVFTQLSKLYLSSLELDPDDVEANFNLAGLYTLRKELDQALSHFKACVRKDQNPGLPEIQSLFAHQFAKAYFNMALIYDSQEQLRPAIENYEVAFQKMIDLRNAQQFPDQYLGDSFQLDVFFKTAVNLAVSYEKDNKQERSLQILNTLKHICPQPADVKVSINMGTILQK